MLRHKFMMRNIDQQIAFLKRLHEHATLQRCGYDLQSSGRNAALCDVDSRFEILFSKLLRECTELFYANVGFGSEDDGDGADLGDG